MKKEFEKPELIVINFLSDDVIRTSSHAEDYFGPVDDDSGFLD